MDIEQGIAEDTQATIKCSICSQHENTNKLASGRVFQYVCVKMLYFKVLQQKWTWSLAADLESGRTSVKPGAALAGP